jgi:hypothetical protein
MAVLIKYIGELLKESERVIEKAVTWKTKDGTTYFYDDRGAVVEKVEQEVTYAQRVPDND